MPTLNDKNNTDIKEQNEDENVTINDLAEQENNVSLLDFKVMYNNYSDDLSTFIQVTNMQFVNDRFGIAFIKLHDKVDDNYADDDYTIFVLDKTTNIIYMHNYIQQQLTSPPEKIVNILKQSKIYTKYEFIDNPFNTANYNFVVDNCQHLIDLLSNNSLVKWMDTNNNDRFRIYIFNSITNKSYLFVVDMKGADKSKLNIFPNYNYFSADEYNEETQYENNIFALIQQLETTQIIRRVKQV